MAKIARGISYAENEYITAAKLHALVDTAIAAADGFPGTPDLYDIVFLNFVANVKPFHTASSPASPAANELAVGADGKIDRYTGAAWADPYQEFVYYVNGSAITLTTGTPVVADVSSMANCTTWGGPGACPDVLGISMTACAPSATAQIQMHGTCVVRLSHSPLAVTPGFAVALYTAGATMMSRGVGAVGGTSESVAVVLAVDGSDSSRGYAVLLR